MGKLKPDEQYAFVSNKMIYVLLIISILSLLVSSYALYEIKLQSAGQKVDIGALMSKLNAHSEMSEVRATQPQNILRIDNSNIINLQSSISGIDATFLGDYIIQYPEFLVVYDYANDKIRGVVRTSQQQASLPKDFFTKLNSHKELSGTGNQSPTGGVLDQVSLDTLKAQLPDVYKDAKVGDYLLRYTDRLIIYDYRMDNVVNALVLRQEQQG